MSVFRPREKNLICFYVYRIMSCLSVLIFPGFEFNFKSTCACVPTDDSEDSEEDGERVARSEEVSQGPRDLKDVRPLNMIKH